MRNTFGMLNVSCVVGLELSSLTYCVSHSSADLQRQGSSVFLRYRVKREIVARAEKSLTQSASMRVVELHDVIQHIPSVHIFKYQANMLWILKRLYQTADILML
jgi:hypothetical protein